MLELGISLSAWRNRIAISSYRTSRNKKIESELLTGSYGVQTKEVFYQKKKSTVRISSLSNLNIII